VEKATQSSPSGTTSRPTAAAAPQSEVTRRRRFGRRESKRPCFRDASILLVMTAAAGAEAGTRSRLRLAADSESSPPRAPLAVARLALLSQRSADSASQFPLGAVFGDAWVLAGLCGLTHLFASSLDRGKSTRTGSLGTQARCGSRRGTFGASTASALGLCAQPAYTRFVRTVTSSAVVDVPSQSQPRRLKKAGGIASATSSVPTPTPTNVSQPPMLLTR